MIELDDIFNVYLNIDHIFAKYAENEEQYKLLSYSLCKTQEALLNNKQVPCIQAPLLVYQAIKKRFSKTIYTVTAASTIFYLFLDLMDDVEDNELKNTIWEEIGQEEAINTANSFIFLSFLTLNTLRNKYMSNKLKDELWKWGYMLTLGQGKDIASKRMESYNINDCLKIIRQKAGASAEMYCRMGAIAATEDEELVELYGKAGRYWGMAIQILGDYVNIWEKGISTDLLNQKKILPIAYAHEHATKEQKRTLYAALNRAYKDKTTHTVIRQILEKNKTKEYLFKSIKAYKAKAINYLHIIERKWHINNTEIKVLIDFIRASDKEMEL